MKPKYDYYITDADPEGVTEALAWMWEFYKRYPTGHEVAEALHQLRKELNLIEVIETKQRQFAKLQQELNNED
jgi:hypothetical protein